MPKQEVWDVGQQEEVFPILWQEARSIWDRCENQAGFEAYVEADYRLVLESLRKFQGKGVTFLEWGAGLGVVTIMASRLGFEAYGLEISPQLVDYSRTLAQRFAPAAQFALGSFVPSGYRWNPELDEDGSRTDFESADGYEALDMSLADFDIVYVYPWPHEHAIFKDILRHTGGKVRYC